MRKQLILCVSAMLLIMMMSSIALTHKLENQYSFQAEMESKRRQADPLVYAVFFARQTNNDHALGEIAVHYAELGDFEQAIRINDALQDDDVKASSLSKIALQYWKRGDKERSRQLFTGIALMPIPKDVSYVWGPIMDGMAEAQQFDLALYLAASMPESETTATRAALETIVDHYLLARAKQAQPPDILPRVLRIGRSLRKTGEEGRVIAKVAVAYAARGELDRATKLIQGLEEGYDREDASHEVAIQLARDRHYDRALQLAEKAGDDYFGPIALVHIATEALRRGDQSRASEIVSRALSLLLKKMKQPTHTALGSEAERLSEIAVLYSDLGQKPRALEVMSMAFESAGAVGKPGERYRALEKVVASYSRLGLFDLAIKAALAINERMKVKVLAEAGAQAVEKRLDARASEIIKAISDTSLEGNEVARAEGLISIAVEYAKHQRNDEALNLLSKTVEQADAIPAGENRSETLKKLAVAFAEAGDFHRALRRVPLIKEPYFITGALIEIGYLRAKTGQAFDEQSVKLLDEIVNVRIAPPREPRRLVKESGWEIPGLAQSRINRPRELWKLRDRSVQRYRTFYEPLLEIFIKRPFELSAERKTPGQQSVGLKILMIEEHDVHRRKYCYAVITQEVFRDEMTNLPKYSTSFETFLYYDEDGDGIFETLEDGAGPLHLPRIPKWLITGNR